MPFVVRNCYLDLDQKKKLLHRRAARLNTEPLFGGFRVRPGEKHELAEEQFEGMMRDPDTRAEVERHIKNGIIEITMPDGTIIGWDHERSEVGPLGRPSEPQVFIDDVAIPGDQVQVESITIPAENVQILEPVAIINPEAVEKLEFAEPVDGETSEGTPAPSGYVTANPDGSMSNVPAEQVEDAVAEVPSVTAETAPIPEVVEKQETQPAIPSGGKHHKRR